jgi:hypothetical protein
MILLTINAWGQPSWKRNAPAVDPELQVFHTSQSMGLPTAQPLKKGNFEFEISHRFYPPVSEGLDAFFGFDGPTNMRIAVGYAISNSVVVTLGRSNVDDNVDLWIKYGTIRLENGILPTMIAFRAGAAWNIFETWRLDDAGNLHIRKKKNKHHFQYFGQAMIDIKIHRIVGLGLVPSFLINRNIRMDEFENAFMLGTHIQIYLNRHWSVMGEWSPVISDKAGRHNPGAFGFELETGAHIFQLFLSNHVEINPSQYIAGADLPFDSDKLRLGFMINRLL